MAIKISGTTVITNSRELDCSSGFIVFNPKSSLPTASPENGDTLYLSTINSLVTYFNGLWVSQIGVIATGGNSTETSSGRKFHIFTSPGTFSVVAKPSVKDLEVFMVGGGGGAGRQSGGGGGAGEIKSTTVPFDHFTPGNSYGCTVTVGSGGNGGGYNPGLGANGGDTSCSFSGVTTLSAVGGGRGGALNTADSTSRTSIAGSPGASGGGGGSAFRSSQPGGARTVPTGNYGGSGTYSYDSYFAAGGGGSPQSNGSPASGTSGGLGGAAIGISGLPSSVGTPGPDASRRYFAGGGCGTGWSSGRARPTYGGAGGSTGSGNVFYGPSMAPQLPRTNALANTGSGGGGRSWNSPNSGYSNGGSGIVILSYLE
jgi:hypothetical protein